MRTPSKVAGCRRCPRGELDRQDSGEPERFGEVAGEVEKETRQNGADDQGSEASPALNAQRENGGEQHHGAQEQRLGEHRVEVEAVRHRG